MSIPANFIIMKFWTELTDHISDKESAENAGKLYEGAIGCNTKKWHY